MMNAKSVEATLAKVLTHIQAASGLDCPTITNATKPLEDLPNFDSKIWPVATGLIAAELGINIPDDINIFKQEKGCIALTIQQTIEIILTLSASQDINKDEAKAAL